MTPPPNEDRNRDRDDAFAELLGGMLGGGHDGHDGFGTGRGRVDPDGNWPEHVMQAGVSVPGARGDTIEDAELLGLELNGKRYILTYREAASLRDNVTAVLEETGYEDGEGVSDDANATGFDDDAPDGDADTGVDIDIGDGGDDE